MSLSCRGEYVSSSSGSDHDEALEALPTYFVSVSFEQSLPLKLSDPALLVDMQRVCCRGGVMAGLEADKLRVLGPPGVAEGVAPCTDPFWDVDFSVRRCLAFLAAHAGPNELPLPTTAQWFLCTPVSRPLPRTTMEEAFAPKPRQPAAGSAAPPAAAGPQAPAKQETPAPKRPLPRGPTMEEEFGPKPPQPAPGFLAAQPAAAGSQAPAKQETPAPARHLPRQTTMEEEFAPKPPQPAAGSPAPPATAGPQAPAEQETPAPAPATAVAGSAAPPPAEPAAAPAARATAAQEEAPHVRSGRGRGAAARACLA